MTWVRLTTKFINENILLGMYVKTVKRLIDKLKQDGILKVQQLQSGCKLNLYFH